MSSDNAHVLVPATVTVPAGASTKTFSIKTTAVAALENATITATTFGLSSPGQMLTLTPMAIKSLSLSPMSVVGGTPITGSVRLQCAAGPGDVVVALSSTQPSAAFPASPTVTVPFGTATAPFTVTTLPVAKTVKATIQATANGITKTKNVSVTPAP